MKAAIYAGSFDPWSFGHQFILTSALEVFDCVHILAAINPAKHETLDPASRARIIAHAINPFTDWWKLKPPFHIGKNVVVTATTGLVANYALENKIKHLVRGLRSTSDFEAEFNLYFSNRAILPKLQTWAIMCPPELLHCSSTYVRSVVGKPQVDFVGTSFTAQSLMLKHARAIGEVFDLIQACSVYRFECEPADLSHSDLNAALQLAFTNLLTSESQKNLDRAEKHIEDRLSVFRSKRASAVKKTLMDGGYPAEDVAQLWSILIHAMSLSQQKEKSAVTLVDSFGRLAGKLGKTAIPLFDKTRVQFVLSQMLKATPKRK